MTECFVCKKKLKLSSYPCKCNQFYCKKHIPENEHLCTFDYKNQQKKIISKQNPVIVPLKI